jgi:hypothetical protein
MTENKWIEECKEFFGKSPQKVVNVKIKLIKETKDYVLYEWYNPINNFERHYKALVVKKEEKIFCWGMKSKHSINKLHYRYAFKNKSWETIEHFNIKGFRLMKNPDKIMNIIRMEII